MILTSDQKEYLEPMMKEYEHFVKVQSMSFNHFGRVVEVYLQHGIKINYCNSCGDDKLKFVKEMYEYYKL